MNVNPLPPNSPRSLGRRLLDAKVESADEDIEKMLEKRGLEDLMEKDRTGKENENVGQK